MIRKKYFIINNDKGKDKFSFWHKINRYIYKERIT
jgi:hypothetical protein